MGVVGTAGPHAPDRLLAATGVPSTSTRKTPKRDGRSKAKRERANAQAVPFPRETPPHR